MRERKFIPPSIGRRDPNFENSTNLYRNPLAEQRKGDLQIWGVVTDTGAGNAMMPVFEQLTDSHAIRVLAREAGAAAIVDNGINFTKPPYILASARLKHISGDVVVTGMASNPTLELLAHDAARENGIKTGAIEDYPGAYGSELKAAFANPQLRPDRLFVMNDWAVKANLAELPWLSPDYVFPTGQPAFDYIAREDREGVKSEVRQLTGITPGDKLVVWMGQKEEPEKPLKCL